MSQDIDKNIDEKWKELEKAIPSERKQVLQHFCELNIKLKEQEKLSVEEASYNICGACSLLIDDVFPEYEEVMNIACDLELGEYSDRSKDDWQKLKSLIEERKNEDISM